MKKYLFSFLMSVLLFQFTIAQNIPDGYKKIKELGGIEEFKMESNDLTVLLMEDHSVPVLTFLVTYLVGSKNEVIGTTGATHILEHLMFKGTPTFNKKNGNSIPSTLENIGAVMNANTWTDRTNYFENIPSDKLELAIHIESDRMRNALILDEDRKSEMTVVRNEFEQGENDPTSALDKEMWATAYFAHPYHHSTIGWKSDIENMPIEKLKEFYNVFYWPNNAVVSVIGDFDKTNTLQLIKNYFGKISRSPHEIPKVYTEEPEQQGPRRVVVKRAGQLGVVGVGYKSPPGLHEDAFEFLVIENILTAGKTSRLYKSIIDKNLGVSAATGYVPFKDAGLFPIYVTLAPGIKHEDVEKVILDEIEKLKNEGVTKDEVDRAISQISAQTIYGRDGSFSIADQLYEFIAKGDWTAYVTFLDKIKLITPEDVQKVGKKYFVEDKSVTGYFIPKSGGEETAEAEASNFIKEKSGFNYRNNGEEFVETGDESLIQTSENQNTILENDVSQNPSPAKGREVKREKIEGIDVVTVKTGVQNVVTFTGSFIAGDYYSPENNCAVADLTARMLDKGTTKNDKFALAEKLGNLGAQIAFGVGTHTVTFNGKCLKNDVEEVINLLAEQLRNPAFSEEEFNKLKTQFAGQMKQNLDDPNTQAFNELNRILFPENHPNHAPKTETIIADIEKTTLAEVKDFYKKFYGPESMIFVAVGDIDNAQIQKSIETSFGGWNGGIKPKQFDAAPKVKGQKAIVTIKDKASTSLMVGQATQLKKSDPDYIPLHFANYVLGGNFTARLMYKIRDDEGLTYGIYSFHTNDIQADGGWYIQGAFNPSLLQKGLESTNREIKNWIEKGITEEELENKKSTIVGQFKVQLSTTNGIANQIHSFLQRGFDVDYLEEYPKLIESLTLEQVNKAIKKYINPENIVTVMAGSIDENGQPLTENK